VKIGEQG